MNPEDFDAGPLAEVALLADADRPTVVFVRHLRHSPATVWNALTDPEQLRAWSPFTADRNLGTTGPATLRMVDGEDVVDLPGAVTQADAPKLLEYTWGTDLLCWQLDAIETGTRLTLHHRVQSRDMAPKVAAGWHLCLVVAEHALDGEPIGPIVGQDAMRYGWQDLRDAYAEQLGIRED